MNSSGNLLDGIVLPHQISKFPFPYPDFFSRVSRVSGEGPNQIPNASIHVVPVLPGTGNPMSLRGSVPVHTVSMHAKFRPIEDAVPAEPCRREREGQKDGGRKGARARYRE